MDPFHCQLLDKHRAALIRDMGAISVVDHLMADTLNRHHEREIESQLSSDAKNRTLLKILTEIPNSYAPFIAALRASGQYQLADLLQKAEASAASNQGQSAGTASGHDDGGIVVVKRHQMLTKEIEGLFKKNFLVTLAKKMELAPILTRFDAESLFGVSEMSSVQCLTDSYKQNTKFLDILLKKDTYTMCCFFDEMEDSGQNSLLNAQVVTQIKNLIKDIK